MAASLSDALAASTAASSDHLYVVCECSLGRPPLRAKVDRQSFDELKPLFDKVLALLEWFVGHQKAFVALLTDLASSPDSAAASALTVLVEALDACVLLENQFGGWSQCVNRFSWFKRTFSQMRGEVAGELDIDALQRDINKFQELIGARRARELRVPR